MERINLGKEDWDEVENVERLLEEGNIIRFNGKEVIIHKNFRLIITKTD
jgi:hypothetical protein